MHGVRCMRSAVTGDASGRGKRTKEKTHTVDVLRNLRMHVGIRPLEVGASVKRRPSVAGSRDVNNIRIGFADQAVQMHVDEILPGRCAPMPQQTRLDVLFPEWLPQHGIVEKKKMPTPKIILP